MLIPSSDLGPEFQIDQDTINVVEQVSLLRCQNKQDRDRLGEAVRLASHLLNVDTSSVEPLVHIHETENCPLREDMSTIRPGVKRKLLNLSSNMQEDYYIVPGK